MVRTLDQLHRRLNTFHGAATRMAAFAVGYVGADRAIRGTIGSAIDFEEKMADVAKVTNLTTSQLADAGLKIRDLSKVLPVAATGLADIYATAAQSGVATDELLRFTEMAAKVAVAWDASAGDTTQRLAEIKTQLGLTNDEILAYADAVNELSNQTASRTPDLVDYSRRVAATGDIFGFTATQTLAFGSAMISAGGESEVAATSFRNMGRALTKGASATKAQRTAYARLGLDSVKTAKRMQKDALATTLDVIDRIQKLPEWQQASVASMLFGDEARALMPVIRNSKELRHQLGIVADGTKYAGSAFREYEQRAKTTANSLRLFGNSAVDIFRGIGNEALPSIRRFADASAYILNTMNRRASVFDKLKVSIGGFTKGLGFESTEVALSRLGQILETGIFGSIDDTAGERLGRLFEKMRRWGDSVRQFATAVAENPVAKFVGEMSGYGFKLAVASVALSTLAGALMRLGKAAMFLSGLSAAIAVVRGLVKATAGITAAGVAIAGLRGARAAETALPAGASAAGAAGAKVIEKAGSNAAGHALAETGRRSTERTLLAETASKLGASAGLLGRAATRILGLPSIAAEVTTRALLDTPPADLRLIDPEYAPKAYRKVEDRNAGRQQEPAQLEAPEVSEPKPFSFGQIWKDLTAPIKPTVDNSEIEKWATQSDATAKRVRDTLSVTAKPIVDTSSIDMALRKSAALKAMLSGMVAGGSSAPTVVTSKFGGPRASGGPVKRGVTYLVGEEGPEPFTPGADGYISPNSALDDNAPAPRRRNPIAMALNPDGTDQAGRDTAAPELAQYFRQAIKQGDTNIVNHFNIHGGDPTQVAKRIVDTLNRQLIASRQSSMDDRPLYEY
jgi:TP901 family phage tail tape measure protein